MLQVLTLVLICIPLVAGNSILRGTNEETLATKDGLMRALDAPRSEVSATEIIDKINEDDDVEPNLYEGDILFPEGTGNKGSEDEREKRNAQRNRKSIWTGKVVPYQISQRLIEEGFDATILAAIEEFTKHTCIKWKPHENEANWVNFIYGIGCYSSVGMTYSIAGSQDISLGRGCNHRGVIMHEMMHALGFWHEQSRPDRDKYVEIMWENIKPGKEHNFNKYKSNTIDYLNQVYDLDSLMHYGRSTFSTDYQKPTIQALGNPGRPLGQRNGFSPTDILQLNALYDCSNPSGGWSSWSGFGPCNSQCKHTRQRFCSSHDRNYCPGADSYGVETETADCPNEKCYAPLDGHWSRWSSWSTCSVTCNSGTFTRTRKCEDPSPKNGGKDCVGDKLQTGKCELRRCGQGAFDCEFEVDKMCHWKICSKASYYPRWFRHSGRTGSCKTGPRGDHTSGSGNYMYFEASSPARKGDSACFKSQKLPATACQRLTFWYHMYGSGMGTLNVWLESDDGANRQRLWSKTGQQGNRWQQASVDISTVSEYEISFEGVRGDNFRGDIAVDDVLFKNCSGTTSAPPQLQKVLDSCDFEKRTMCDWKNDLTNNVTRNKAYDWELHKGKTWSMHTGPTEDHTSANGTYIYLEGSYPQIWGVKGRLISKQFQANSAICLQFWYHMYGGNVGSLAVHITDGGDLKVEKWKKSGNQNNEWHYKSITLNSDKSFKIIFEGIRGWSWQSDIALDDIKVVTGPCAAAR